MINKNKWLQQQFHNIPLFYKKYTIEIKKRKYKSIDIKKKEITYIKVRGDQMFQNYNYNPAYDRNISNISYTPTNYNSMLNNSQTRSSILNTLLKGPATNSLATGITKAKFSWGALLTNTQKTLGIINQSIPIINQAKPIWNNAKTMFKIMGALNEKNIKKDDTIIQKHIATNLNDNKPKFYI